MTTSITQNEIAQIIALCDIIKAFCENYQKSENEAASDTDNTTEMLTIKECMQLTKNVSYYTISKWIKQGKVVAIRAGEGIRGKYLINKASIIACANGAV